MATSDHTAETPIPDKTEEADSLLPLPAMSGVQFLLVTVVLVLVSIATHLPYVHLVFIEDDIGHLRGVGSVQVGMETLGEFVWSGANEHFSPIWKLWYYFMWRCFGVEPAAWHIFILAAHGVTAAWLFFLLRHYLNSNLAAWVGAFCWSVAAISAWDNPLSFISASHLTFGFLWLLAAMCCVTQFSGPASTPWALAMAACQSVAILNMGAMWVLTPIVPAQFIILEYRRPVDRKRLRAWALAWLIPFLVLGYIQTTATLPKVALESDHAGRPDVRRGIVRTAAEFQTTLASLWLRPVDHEERFGIAPAAAIGAGCIAVLFLIPKINRRFLLVSFGLCVVYTILVHTMRAYPDERAMHWGRYAYIPIFAWCTAIAAIVALPQFHRTTFDRRCLALVLLVAIPFFTIRQLEFTQLANEVYEKKFSKATSAWKANQRYLEQIVERANARNQPVVLIDFPITFAPAVTARIFHACLDLGENRNLIQFVTPADTSDEEHNLAMALMSEIENPQKEHWFGALEHTRQLATFLQTLSVKMQQLDQSVILPDIGVTVDQGHLPVTFLKKYVFFEGLPGIEFVDKGEITSEIAESSTLVLKTVPGHVAKDFVQVLHELAENNAKL